MDYEKYSLSLKEWMVGIGIYAFIDAIVSYFFYRSAYVFAALLAGFYPFFLLYRKELIRRRKKHLLDEFSEVLLSVSINMKSGYSLENAFVEAYKDITMFYGEKSLMADEINKIRKGLEINITLEELIVDLAKRSKEKDILLFSDVCRSAKRNGGNITEVLSNTADRIRGGICVDNEIDTILSEKKLEFRIMEAVPFVLMAYLEATSEGYFNVMYEGLTGRIFMTVCLVVYIVAILIGRKILQIKV